MKSYDIRNQQSFRIRCEKSNSKNLPRLLCQLNIYRFNFWWIRSINCHFNLKRKSLNGSFHNFFIILLLIELA